MGAVTAVATADVAADAAAAGACDPDRVIAGASPTDLIGKTFDLKAGMARLVATPLTCSQGKTWYSPYEGKLKQIPDQLDFMDVSAACQQETMTTISNMTSAWEYSAKSFGFNIGIGIGIGDVTVKIGIGFQKQVADIASRMSNYTSTLTTLHRNMAMYRLAFGTAGSTPTRSATICSCSPTRSVRRSGTRRSTSRCPRALPSSSTLAVRFRRLDFSSARRETCGCPREVVTRARPVGCMKHA